MGEAAITKARNDWSKNPDGQGYLQRLSEIAAGRPAVDLNRFRREFEALYGREISRAEKSAASKKVGRVGSTSALAAGMGRDILEEGGVMARERLLTP